LAKILSQDEIDALLTTVSAGEPEVEAAPSGTTEQLDRTVVTYDFKHPNRVSKDQVRTFENIHDNFAGHIGSTLSAMLRTMVDVDLVSVDQINYSEYIMSLVSPSCSYTFSTEALEGLCVVDFNPSLAFAFVDRMFGGGEKFLEIERELTGIEKAIMAKIVKRIYNDLGLSWQNIVTLNIKENSFENNPQFMQIIPSGETVIVVSLQLKMFKTTGLLTICYPYVSLEPVLTKLSAQNWIDATKKKMHDDAGELNRENIQSVDVPIALTLAHTKLKMRDFLNLKLGDVIATDTEIRSLAELAVGDRFKFKCRPGLFGKKRAGQIVEIHPVIMKE